MRFPSQLQARDGHHLKRIRLDRAKRLMAHDGYNASIGLGGMGPGHGNQPTQGWFFTQTLFDCFVYRGYGDLVASERYQPVGAQPSLIRKGLRADLQCRG